MGVMIPCDPSARYAIPLHYVAGAKYETAAEGFIFVLPSIYGCPDNKPLPAMASSVLSFGWVFVILLFVAVTLYFAIGICYKMHKYGKRGEDALPHIDFWRELPYLVKDGISFAVGKARSCNTGVVTGPASRVILSNPYDTVM